ncbi:redoxin domain-containing protein [Paraliomyxa miuraensis]|uniref:redoxin domain-containing protein n=1 Tax=Paraliomyxa miuraensis TaxID=376150 RepID=UPI002255F108|nr:redoxin domain-containing protein [Paraliomyxa miuraensis]MCX4242216.1 peroxiredoxin family protein [Paraliomyxa miuraensis]
MQVGDLQAHLAEFDERGVSLVVISVDEPEDSLPWAQKKGLTVPLASDPELALIRRFGLENRDQPGLALHAVYIVDEDGKVFYRKVARRRPYSQEFLDAIDYHYRERDGRWPRGETAGRG